MFCTSSTLSTLRLVVGSGLPMHGSRRTLPDLEARTPFLAALPSFPIYVRTLTAVDPAIWRKSTPARLSPNCRITSTGLIAG